LLSFVDHGTASGGEPVAELLRPGKAGSNTAADHVVVLDTALAQLPAPLRTRDATGRIPVLVRTDARRCTQEFAAHLHQQAVEISVGASFAYLDVHTALAQLPAATWTPAYQARTPRAAETGVQIEPREGAWVAEATGLIPLTGWPPGTRLILRKERPHPGAQLRITDADGLRVTEFLTNTARRGPGAQPADLELRHRHARVEDRIRAAKDTGLRNLPFHDTDQNRIWITISALAQDLLAWCARLALPATTAGYEPKRLRLRDPRHRRTTRALRATPRPVHRPDLALGHRDHHRTRTALRTPGPLNHAPDPTSRTRSTGRTTPSR